jgi:lauroyl/myristoyl acyltransferase
VLLKKYNFPKNKIKMSKILVDYSPYRNNLRRERANQVADQKPVAAVAEIVKFELSPVSMMVILSILTVLLGCLYLMNFNKNATKGYILKRLEVSSQELKEQSDMRTLSLANAKAMNQMIESGAMDHMRKPNQVSYVFAESVIAKAD